MNKLCHFIVILIFVTTQVGMADNIPPSDCYNYLTELVRSSNFPFEYTTKENVNLLIDTDDNEEILAQLNYIKDEKDSPENERTGIIGWVEYSLSDNTLYNSSAYLETPEKLTFDTRYAISFKQCRDGTILSNNNLPTEKNNLNSLAVELSTYCKDISNSTFTDKYVCSYPNQKLADVYLRIKKVDENNRKFLKDTVPTKNINYRMTQSDVEVKYIWLNKKMLKISLNFAGGTTTLVFEEKNSATTLLYTAESDS